MTTRNKSHIILYQQVQENIMNPNQDTIEQPANQKWKF